MAAFDRPTIGAWTVAILVLASVAAATWLVHGATVRYGFNYDDYHTVRPYTTQEVLRTFFDTWDLRGEVMVPFFRPVTTAFHALRFEMFGLNSQAHHIVSLALFAIAAALTSLLVYRLTGRPSGAIIAALVYVAHPAQPYSAVAWITNQMHLLQALTVLAALTWWDTVRARRTVWWLPLLLFGALSFLIKEDGVVLLPAILILHALRRRVVERDLQPVPVTFLALAGCVLLSLIGVRFSALEGLGGYGTPSWQAAWPRVLGTLYGVYRLVPADREWQPLASVFATWLPLVAFASWRWISPAARMCLLSGVVVAVLSALPFAFVAKAEQVYLIALGMALALTGSSLALFELAQRVPARRIAAAAAAITVGIGLTSFAIVARDIDRDFEPFGPLVLANDDIVRTWWTVPPELRDYLARKREAGTTGHMSPNPVDELAHASFGFVGPELNPAGQPYLWMTGSHVEIQVARHLRQVTIPIRHQMEAFREASLAIVVVDGRLADEIKLADSEWHMVTIRLRPGDATTIGRMHRIRITIPHAWKPSEVIRGSTDERVLGLQIGPLQTR